MAQVGGGPEVSDKQACESCLSGDVRPVSLTSVAVNFRCERCGHVWSMAERRKQRRDSDRERFVSRNGVTAAPAAAPNSDPFIASPKLQLCRSCGLWTLYAHGSDADCVTALRDALSRAHSTPKLRKLSEGLEHRSSADADIQS